MAEEWEALLRDNSVMRLLGIDSLRAFEAYKSNVSRNAFVRTAVLRVLAFLLPEHDPFNDLHLWGFSWVLDLRWELTILMGFTAFLPLGPDVLESPPAADFVHTLKQLERAFSMMVLHVRANRLSFVKDAKFRGQRVQWTDVRWPVSETVVNVGHDAETNDFIRTWLRQGAALDDAAILLGDPEHPLLTSILGEAVSSTVAAGDTFISTVGHEVTPVHARLVWPYAMQHRLPVMVDECARVLPVKALPELFAEYLFGDAVRDWL
jgi:hypothetical protein